MAGLCFYFVLLCAQKDFKLHSPPCFIGGSQSFLCEWHVWLRQGSVLSLSPDQGCGSRLKDCNSD